MRAGRRGPQVRVIEAYCKAQGLFHGAGAPDPVFTDTVELDLANVEPSLAGPRRPHDRVALSGLAKSFPAELPKLALPTDPSKLHRAVPVTRTNYDVKDGAVVLAAIPSCTH